MVTNYNIFNVSNPAKILDGLWQIIGESQKKDYSKNLIFLPSRRSVKSVTNMFVQKLGAGVILPELVPLGEEGFDGESDIIDVDVISNTERIVLLTKLLMADDAISSFSVALPLATQLLRMLDYIENEGINPDEINFIDLVDEKYAKHFKHKAKFLDILTKVFPAVLGNSVTKVQHRNAGVLGWVKLLKNYEKIIVCGSTASVPVAAKLMQHIANMDNGYIILPGKISGNENEFLLPTNPYFSEYKFIKSLNKNLSDIKTLDVGNSDIDFFNTAFSNSGIKTDVDLKQQLIETENEAGEADVVAEIAEYAKSHNKSVLVITPDAAANTRIFYALEKKNISSDFSGGISGNMTYAGRAVLNFLEDAIENKDMVFDTEYNKCNFDLFKALQNCYEKNSDSFKPEFDIESDDSIAVWESIKNLSDVLLKHNVILNLWDSVLFIKDVLKTISVRGQMNDGAIVKVLGTVESRMQTADIVILTGLNDGMFPALGYENPWLPLSVTNKIGLPPPARKVSLMALDFMNLSCAENVFWLRSKTSGTSGTIESRFLSRVNVCAKSISKNTEFLSRVLDKMDVKKNPLNYAAPNPPAQKSNLYVTDLELLIHNPYAFYVKKILKLRPIKDEWENLDQRDFGNMVHSVVENAIGKTEEQIVNELENFAKDVLPKDSILFYFWQRRFKKMAPQIVKFLQSAGDKIYFEIEGHCRIAGRNIRARADIVYDGVVADVKTGAAPNKSQLKEGNMPQLPIEAFMLQSGGFPIEKSAKRPVIKFLQLQNNNEKEISYDEDMTAEMIDVAVQKVTELLMQYSKDFAIYEYRETGNQKYQEYDDFARRDD